MFQHCRVILRKLEINALQVTPVFYMQQLVIQFIIWMFYIGFMQVLLLWSLKSVYYKIIKN
jgi:hypothetical protein